MVSLSRIQLKLSRLAVLGLMAASIALPTAASAVSQPRDCDASSIVYCGAYSKSELMKKVKDGDTKNSGANIRTIYYNEGRGMTEANFLSSKTVDGVVTRDGKVIVGGKTVATDAHGIGRTYKPGSVKDHSVWMRPDTSAFLSDIQAWVYMENGQVKYYLLKSCGNLGVAKSVVKPTPTPTPTVTPKPTPTPTPKPTPAAEQSFKCVEVKTTQPNKVAKPATFRFTVTGEVDNVELTGYRFTVKQRGTTTADVNDTDAKTPFAEYTLGAGTWDINTQIKTSAGITSINDNCSTSVTVAAAPTPTPTPAGKGQVLGASLPATGPEAALGGVAGLTAIGYASRAYLRSRKGLRDAMRTDRTRQS